MSERAFMNQVISLARLYDWKYWHAPDNRPIQTRRGVRMQHVVPGWPDLTLVRDSTLIFAELKAEKGRVTPAQVEWLAALENVPGVETYIWRPGDWDEINARLSQGRHRLERAA